MRHFRYILLPLLACLLYSCEKEIDFDYHDIPPRHVIEGLLTQQGVSVRLTETVPTDEPFSDATVTDATVTLTDATDNAVYRLQPDSKGIFTHTSLAGLTGHLYELNVRIGDESFTSSCRMLPPTEIVSAEFNWIRMPYDDVAVLRVCFTADADKSTCYWLRVFRNGEAYEWQAIESRNVTDGIAVGLMMTSRRDTGEEDDDKVLEDGDVIDIEVLPVSRVMADYLNSLNNGDYNGNLMFSGDYALGYFLAAPVASTRIVFHPDLIPYD